MSERLRREGFEGLTGGTVVLAGWRATAARGLFQEVYL